MSKQKKEALISQAEDGDALADAVLHDLCEEEGMDGVLDSLRIKKGRCYVIYTVTYFSRGLCLGEDHEYIYLAPGSELIYETGEIESFYKGEAGRVEIIPTLRRIRKGSIQAVDDYIPTKKQLQSWSRSNNQ